MALLKLQIISNRFLKEEIEAIEEVKEIIIIMAMTSKRNKIISKYNFKRELLDIIKIKEDIKIEVEITDIEVEEDIIIIVRDKVVQLNKEEEIVNIITIEKEMVLKDRHILIIIMTETEEIEITIKIEITITITIKVLIKEIYKAKIQQIQNQIKILI